MLEERHRISRPPAAAKSAHSGNTSAVIKLWMTVIPDLARIPSAERKKALAEAAKSPLLPGELKTLVAWLLIVFAIIQVMLGNAPVEDALAASLIANIFVGIPLLLVVYVPLHIKRIRRDIRRQLTK